MKKFTAIPLMFAISSLLVGQSHATGRMTCDSGDKSNWKTETELVEKITADGWTVRKVKEDGGCYEVYGRGGRDRNAGYPAPLAQIPAGAANAPGSCLEFWRQSELPDTDGKHALQESSGP